LLERNAPRKVCITFIAGTFSSLHRIRFGFVLVFSVATLSETRRCSQAICQQFPVTSFSTFYPGPDR